MKIGDLVRHTVLDYHGIVVEKWEKSFNPYIRIHWMTGDLSAIWYQSHQYLEVINEYR